MKQEKDPKPQQFDRKRFETLEEQEKTKVTEHKINPDCPPLADPEE